MSNFQKVTIGDAILYSGDCLELIDKIEDFDALITDPPYSSGGMTASSRTMQPSQKYISSTEYDYSKLEVLGDNKDALGWAFWSTIWMSCCHHRMKDGAPVISFTDWRQLPNTTNVIQAAGFIWRGVGVFAKPNYRRQCGRFGAQAEYFAWGTKGSMGMDYTKKALPGVYTYSAPAPTKRLHMTEKPLQLMVDLLQITQPGCTVFDPFMGAATTGIAALQSSRKFVGIELHPQYFKIACKRVEDFYRNQE